MDAGNEHLPAMAGGGDPSGAVDVQPHVVVAAEQSLTGVKSDSHPDGALLGPRLGGDPSLRLGGGLDGVPRFGKDGEDAVPAG